MMYNAIMMKEELENRKQRLNRTPWMKRMACVTVLLVLFVILWIVWTPPLLLMLCGLLILFVLFTVLLSRASRDAADLSNILALERYEAMEDLSDLPFTGEADSIQFGEKAFCTYGENKEVYVVLSYRMIAWIKPVAKTKDRRAVTVLYLTDKRDHFAIRELTKDELQTLKEKCPDALVGDSEKNKEAWEKEEPRKDHTNHKKEV